MTFLNSNTRSKLRLLTLGATSLLTLACTPVELLPWQGPALSAPRSQLTVAQLTAENSTVLPLMDMSFWARPAWAESASNGFSGTLTFHDTPMTYPKTGSPAYAGEDTFPAFAIQFTSQNGQLIPHMQDLIRTQDQSESLWDVMVGKGKVWHENEDGDWNRASFPLSLTDRFIGQVRNCVGTFLYTAEAVSNVYLQCSQETADANDGRLGNLRAMLPVDYAASQALPAQAETLSKTEKYAVLPLSDLDTTGELAGLFERSYLTNASTSLGAVLAKDILYVQPPRTRHGLYPYPEAMRHGLYSVTKSMAGSLAMFYLAERYGPALFEAKIQDYVPALANHAGWQGVTFAHALNMVTGTDGGEDAERLHQVIIVADSTEEAIANVARLGDAAPAPGEAFNYASTHFFVLSYALQNYVKQAEGQDNINYWDLVKTHVLMPLGIPHFNVQHTQENDGTAGIPFLAYGATPTLEEAAKIAALINNEGRFKGQQLLNRQRVREALGKTDWPGYSTQNDWRGPYYRHGFWGNTVDTDSCKVPVTYMLGFGGNYVLLLPHQHAIFRFMDEYDFAYSDWVKSLAKVSNLCERI